MTSDPGFLRLEAKVDKLTDAVMRLGLMLDWSPLRPSK
jgi:hypothetical protein